MPLTALHPGPREVCRWSNPDGTGFIFFADGRLCRRNRHGRPTLLLGGLSFEQARAHVEDLGGYRQCGGDSEHSRRPIRGRCGRVAIPPPAPSAERDTPALCHLSAADLIERGRRVLAHRQRIRDELARRGQLPAGWDELPDPAPHLHDPAYWAAQRQSRRRHCQKAKAIRDGREAVQAPGPEEEEE